VEVAIDPPITDLESLHAIEGVSEIRKEGDKIRFYTDKPVVNPFILAIDIVLSAFCFSALGSLLSSPPTDNPSNVMMLSNLVRLPLIFISGVFIPIEAMPAWGKKSYRTYLTAHIRQRFSVTLALG